MEQFLIDSHISPEDELKGLLDYNGIMYSADPECVRFILEDGVYKWETVCRYARSAVLIYGYYPFETADTEDTLRLLNGINGKLVRGSMFLHEGRVIMRASADLHDAFGACEVIARAIEYNAGAMVEFWRRIRFVNTHTPRGPYDPLGK